MARAILPRMPRGLLALVAVAACGAPAASAPAKAPLALSSTASPPPPEDRVAPDAAAPVDWATARHGTDDEALALWAQLGLTGANFEQRVADIPEAPATLREAMAKALLRSGNFACPVETTSTCGPAEIDRERLDYQLREIPDDATLDDPCMRRVIALWAIDQLDDDDLSGELAADMIALAGLPWPEVELPRAAMYRITDPAVRLNMVAAAKQAGNDVVADELVAGLDLDALRQLALDHHVDGAVTAIGAGPLTLDVFERAVVDPALRSQTRVDAIRELASWAFELEPSDPDRARVIAALDAARAGVDCVAAGAADVALVDVGAMRPLAAPRPRDAEVIRWLCMNAAAPLADPTAPWRTLAGPAGVVIRRITHDPYALDVLRQEHPDVPDADGDGLPDLPREELDPDGDGDPARWTEVERVTAGDFGDAVASYLDELTRAVTSCDGTTCTVADAHVTWRLVFGKPRAGKPVLVELVRTESHPDC